MRISFIAIVLLLAATAMAESDSDLFLVEVIFFTQAGAEPRLRPLDGLPDYGNVIDILDARMRRDGQARDLSARGTVPEQYIDQGSLSASMQGVWRSLDQSGHYRPLVSRAWYQHTVRGQRTRTVLLHDDQPLQTGDDMQFGRPSHRLEGTLRYTRDRFHRLALDIAWRQRDEDDLVADRLNQRRTIRPGRLEYFDGPWLAALVLVTPWEGSDQ